MVLSGGFSADKWRIYADAVEGIRDRAAVASETEPLVILRYFGPEVNPDAPAMGAYRKNKFN